MAIRSGCASAPTSAGMWRPGGIGPLPSRSSPSVRSAAGCRRSSTTGVCTRNAECQSEHRRRMYAATKMTEQPVCEICGGPVRSNNSVGVCKANPDCKAEAQRRRYAASNASRRANARRWQQEHREQHLQRTRRATARTTQRASRRAPRKIREKNGVTPKGETRDPYTPTWIYALCNDRDQVLYIGQTVQELSTPKLAPSAGGGGCLAGGDRLYQANRPSAFQGRRPGGAGHDQGLP